MTLIRSVKVVGNDSSLNQVSARSHVPLILSNGLWRHMYYLCGDVYIYLCGDIHTVVGITYVQTYIPLQRPIYLCGDIHTFVESYLPMWRHTYLCRGLSTYVETCIPLQRPSYLCGDIHTFVETYLPMWRHIYLCRDLPTYVETYIPLQRTTDVYEDDYLGMLSNFQLWGSSRLQCLDIMEINQLFDAQVNCFFGCIELKNNKNYHFQ